MAAFTEALQIALASGRGSLIRGRRDLEDDEVGVLVDMAADIIDRNAEFYARRDALRHEAHEILGAIRGSVASALARTLAVADPRVHVRGEGLAEAAAEIKATLLDEAWPVADD